MKSDYESLQQWWDIGKVQIRQCCQQYTQNVTKSLMYTVKVLESEVEELQNLAGVTADRRHTETLELKKSALTKLLGTSAQGALVRSHFQNVAQMDVPSHFFFGLECKNGQKRFIHSLKSNTGHILTDCQFLQ